jgi:hypothetical protein
MFHIDGLHKPLEEDEHIWLNGPTGAWRAAALLFQRSTLWQAGVDAHTAAVSMK